ncbi:hypothetical protein BJ875DRAFT_216959 [Amylocarpus encephaloides]|uniref:Peptide hydrolase n=1 Tax=Amylocarpus encephaloides TaxID=45428 RepID=A0A9P7Y8Q5_9HELO|nr:hypothetical protein BJ875DRAFT_216959 [Amylocarpus encephaloides]
MLSTSILSALLVSSSLVAAAPPEVRPNLDADLRLIKTSEADPGVWVTEDQKIEEYVAKNIYFIDITDIKNETTLARLSTKPEEVHLAARAVAYPTSLTHQAEANALIAQLTQTGPKTWLTTLTNFFNRYYRSTYGTQAGTYLLTQLQTLAAPNPAITVTSFRHSFAQPSLIVRIPGARPDLIIVGAHYDSTGGSTRARGPGADDNGSGVVTQMEALRVLAAAGFQPRNTIELHFYAGEEGGLLGSQAVFASYARAGASVLAMVCQDMTGYSPSGRVSVYTDYGDGALVAYVRRVVTLYTGLAYTTDACGYGCSDHASAYSNGFRKSKSIPRSYVRWDHANQRIAAAYVCDEVIRTSSPYIHSPNDAYSTIDFNAVLRHSKFTVGFLVEASYI